MDALFLDSCPTLCDTMDCSISGFSIRGIFQTRVLEWVAISFSSWSSWPRYQTQVRRFTLWATREAQINIETLLMNISKLFVRKSFPCFLTLHQKYRFTIGQICIIELPVKGLTSSLYKVGVLKKERWENFLELRYWRDLTKSCFFFFNSSKDILRKVGGIWIWS